MLNLDAYIRYIYVSVL